MTKSTLIGVGVPFTRIARITGYLAQTSRFNSAKLKELGDRVKHHTSCDCHVTDVQAAA